MWSVWLLLFLFWLLNVWVGHSATLCALWPLFALPQLASYFHNYHLPQDKCQLMFMLRSQLSTLQHSSGLSLFWATLLLSNDSADVNQSISLSLPVREHTAISIYSKSQISDLFYLYSCYASSSWRLHLVPLFFFHVSSFLFPSSSSPFLSTCSKFP